MKKLNQFLVKQVKKEAEKALKMDANSTSSTIVYQPKAPADLKKYSKIK